ncbi:MAG: hypothetical protein KDC05_16470, partial [Bacteroidales bacterium]|nr:hypothetical protein [Bacteroidales bacterium]
KLVYEFSDLSNWNGIDPIETWDGTIDGKKQEKEVYTYYIRVVFQDKGVREETGNITLLR